MKKLPRKFQIINTLVALLRLLDYHNPLNYKLLYDYWKIPLRVKCGCIFFRARHSCLPQILVAKELCGIS